ncbi:hypothetical protein Ciccas_004308, partial [Cichlidogyrus casuarinus]
VMLKKVMESSKASVELTGGGRFLTEFGLCAPDGKPNTINTIECNNVMQIADSEFQSWTYWDSMFFTKDGKPDMKQLMSFSRVYPEATCGIPGTMFFNTTNGYFKYEFSAVMPAKAAKAMDSSDIPAGFPLLDLFVPEAVHYNGTMRYYIKISPVNITYNKLPDSVSTYRFGSSQVIVAETVITVEIIPKE